MNPEDDRQTEAIATRALADLQVRAVELDARWSARTIADILASTRPAPRRRVKRLIAAAVAVVAAGAGGVAYADGVGRPQVPTFPPMVRVADIMLPDGGMWPEYQGRSATNECTADNNGWSCGFLTRPPDRRVADDDADQVDLGWAGSRATAGPDDTPSTYWPVIVGQVSEPAVTHVHITGTDLITAQRVDLTLPVDPVTRAYSALLPGSTPDPWPGDSGNFGPVGLTITFLDASGAGVRSPVMPEDFRPAGVG